MHGVAVFFRCEVGQHPPQFRRRRRIRSVGHRQPGRRPVFPRQLGQPRQRPPQVPGPVNRQHLPLGHLQNGLDLQQRPHKSLRLADTPALLQILQRIHHAVGAAARRPRLRRRRYRLPGGIPRCGILGGGNHLQQVACRCRVGVNHRHRPVRELPRRLHRRVVSAAQPVRHRDADDLVSVRHQRFQPRREIRRRRLRSAGQTRRSLQTGVELVAGEVNPLPVGNIIQQHIGRNDGNAQTLRQGVGDVRRAVAYNFDGHIAAPLGYFGVILPRPGKDNGAARRHTPQPARRGTPLPGFPARRRRRRR